MGCRRPRLCGDAVSRTAVDMNQFRSTASPDVTDENLLPGAVKYGGLPAFLALCAPGEVFAHNMRARAAAT